MTTFTAAPSSAIRPTVSGIPLVPARPLLGQRSLVCVPIAAVPLVDGLLADVGAVYRTQLTAAAAILVAVLGALLINAQAARAVEPRLTVARPLAEVPLALYLFAWASGLASINYLLLVMRRIAAAPGMLGVLILATLVFIGALMRAGMLVSRPHVADRRPLVHDRPLLAITLAWVVLVAVGSQMR